MMTKDEAVNVFYFRPAPQDGKSWYDGLRGSRQANSGPDSNGCQFFITCTKCDFLDQKHVVFGRVLDGLLVMRKVENVPTGPNNKPKIPVIVSQCGQM